MQKINFQNLPNTTTPVNATNLNDLQDNVEDAIDGVVESGSNANGSYIKYNDGTLIQYGEVSKNVTITNYSNSSQWYYDDGYGITLPLEFINTNYFINVKALGANAITLNVYGIEKVSTTRANFNLSSKISYSYNNFGFEWFAIGRWK